MGDRAETSERASEPRRRKGRLIEWGNQEGETCGLKGSKLAGGVVGGFAATGNPVPKGASQLPRPAIIRLSGVTISVNVLDFELRLEPRPTSVASALVPVPSPTPPPPSPPLPREILFTAL